MNIANQSALFISRASAWEAKTLPYVIAPKEQIVVPLIMWLGESSDVELAGALNLSEERNSHDAVFDALLAAFEVENELQPSITPLSLLKEADD
jgi:glucan phosphoethanolaminetransferase (alkaline phosphatase superfamily)